MSICIKAQFGTKEYLKELEQAVEVAKIVGTFDLDYSTEISIKVSPESKGLDLFRILELKKEIHLLKNEKK